MSDLAIVNAIRDALAGTTVTINAGELELGKLVLKDDTAATTAKVAAANTLVATDGAVAVANYPIASEAHLGQVGGHTKLFDATAFTLDTSAYSSGDVLTDALEFDLALRINDGTGTFDSLMLYDEDDQGVAMTVYVMNANNSLGTKNSAPNISDANARAIMGIIQVSAGDWFDLGGVRVAMPYFKPFKIKAGTGTKKIWLAAVNGTGAPTFTASGLRAAPGISQD